MGHRLDILTLSRIPRQKKAHTYGSRIRTPQHDKVIQSTTKKELAPDTEDNHPLLVAQVLCYCCALTLGLLRHFL